MAYRADIEIAVKGAQELKRLQDRIRDVSTTVDTFNSKIEEIGGKYTVRNINNLTSLLGQAAAEFNKVALGTADASAAARVYVQANDKLNAGLAERLALVKQVKEEERQLRLSEAGRRFGGPAIRETSGTVELGPGPASPVGALVGQKSPVEERTRRILAARKEEAALQEALLKLEIRSATTANERLQLERELGLATLRNVNARKLELAGPQFPMAGPMGLGAYGQGRKPTKGGKGGGLGKTAAGALSNAAVGGAFPLLFGQSGSASVGGVIGGAFGSLIPGIGGFGGSLIGTIIGEKAGQGNKVKELGADIGFSAEQTKLLGVAFQQAGRDFDKFQQSVSTIQGLSLSIEDQGRAIQLASSLTETYKGKIDKVTNAFAGALSTGKVTQGTLNQLTSNGIPIQQALADKYNVSRSAIIQMAKDGQISVQDLIDTLVKVGNEGAKAAGTQKDVFKDSFDKISAAVANFQTTASDAFKQTANSLRVDLGEAVQAVTLYITDLINGFATLAEVAGPALDPIISGYIELEKSIFNAAGAVPAFRDSILSMVFAVLGPLQGVVTLFNQIRNLGTTTKGPERQGPYLPDRLKQKPLQSFIAPSQAAPSGGNKGAGAADTAAKAAAREAERVANIVRDQAAITEQKKLQAQYNQGLFLAEIAKDEVLKIQIEREQKIGELSLQYSKQINDEKAKGNSAAAKEAFTRTALADVQLVELKTVQQLKKLELDRAEQYANTLVDLQYELDLKNAVTEQERTRLQIAYEVAKLEQDKSKGLDAEQIAKIKSRKEQIAAPKTDQETIQQRVGALKDELTELASLSNLVITGADAIGTAFATSFRGIISGTMTAQEALASFFQSVADAFLDMAAQIIAKWITMTILNSVLALFPGGGKGGGNFSPAGAGDTGISWSDAITFQPRTKLAEGGYVTGPTNAMIGEGGESEYVIPASKMSAAMARYGRGTRGEGVIAGSGGDVGSGAAGGTATMAPSAIDVRYTVERINSVDYVTADQFQAGMRQAASQGAKQGERLTLNNLRQNTATRRRVGI